MPAPIREQPRLFRESPRALVRAVRVNDVLRSAPLVTLGMGVLAAVFMAAVGPFGTWKEPLHERLGFWVIGMTGAILAGSGLDHCLRRMTWFGSRPAARAVANVVIFAAPAGLIASALAAVVQGSQIDWPLYRQTVPQILLVGLGFVGLIHLLGRRTTIARHRGLGDSTIGGLLPPKLAGARLLALEAQDHYVRVHTDRGASLVLETFEIALAKVSHLDGARTHRSWWVARGAVNGIERGDGRATLTLSGGTQAPVSRRYARCLRSAGWY